MDFVIYLTGDTHGSFSQIQDVCKKCNPTPEDVVVILGDAGINYSGGFQDRDLKIQISNLNTTFFCIHGNHENRPQNIASYQEKIWHGGRVLYEEEFPSILFPVDGDIFDLDGKKCIVIGGAYSVDKSWRLYSGNKWFFDEQPTPKIKAYVEQQLKEHSVDVVLSHTCPSKYIPQECFLSGIDQSTVDRSTEEWLDKIEDTLDYKAWYLGHWHINKRIDNLHFLFKDVESLIE